MVHPEKLGLAREGLEACDLSHSCLIESLGQMALVTGAPGKICALRDLHLSPPGLDSIPFPLNLAGFESWFTEKLGNKLSELDRATGIYSLDVYSGAPRALGVGWATLPPKALGETLFLPLPGFWWQPAILGDSWGCSPPVSASVFTPLPLCLLHVSGSESLSLLGHPVCNGLRAHSIQKDLIFKNKF